MAGLMHAIMLRNLGHNGRVLEKLSPGQLHSQATGLRVGPDVETFIDTYIQTNHPYAITLSTISQIDKAERFEGRRLVESLYT
jgi:hypothetical protein